MKLFKFQVRFKKQTPLKLKFLSFTFQIIIEMPKIVEQISQESGICRKLLREKKNKLALITR